MGDIESQDTVKRETMRIAIGELFCVIIMIGVYAVIQKLTISVLLGSVVGGGYAVLNFYFLGRGMQRALKYTDEETVRMQIKSSYNFRMIGMVIVVILSFAIPFLDGIACMIPMMFPRLTILALQVFGKIHD